MTNVKNFVPSWKLSLEEEFSKSNLLHSIKFEEILLAFNVLRTFSLLCSDAVRTETPATIWCGRKGNNFCAYFDKYLIYFDKYFNSSILILIWPIYVHFLCLGWAVLGVGLTMRNFLKKIGSVSPNFQNCHYFSLTRHFLLERHIFVSIFDDKDSIDKPTCFTKPQPSPSSFNWNLHHKESLRLP